jgi:hypothetical protein
MWSPSRPTRSAPCGAGWAAEVHRTHNLRYTAIEDCGNPQAKPGDGSITSTVLAPALRKLAQAGATCRNPRSNRVRAASVCR